MSTDALLWIGTLLFAAMMLILAAMRPAEPAEGEASLPGTDSWDPGRHDDRGIDLGGGWTLGGESDSQD